MVFLLMHSFTNAIATTIKEHQASNSSLIVASISLLIILDWMEIIWRMFLERFSEFR